MQSATETYLQSVKTICPGLTDPELSLLAGKLSIQELDRKAVFIPAGKIQRVIGYIVSGLVRSSFVNSNGDEITVGFYAEGEYATHYPAFITQQPSLYSIQCLEPTIMVCLSLEDIQNTYQQLPVYERYGRLIAEEILKQQQARIESFIFQTAEQRYLDFIAQRPTLFNRVSLSQLCSYLGIERQTLTRSRQRLAHQ